MRSRRAQSKAREDEVGGVGCRGTVSLADVDEDGGIAGNGPLGGLGSLRAESARACGQSQSQSPSQQPSVPAKK